MCFKCYLGMCKKHSNSPENPGENYVPLQKLDDAAIQEIFETAEASYGMNVIQVDFVLKRRIA